MNQREERNYHRMTKTVLLLCAVAAAILFLVARVFANDIHLPVIAQRCNPCRHSIPYPTPTATPFINEPPMPTEAK